MSTGAVTKVVEPIAEKYSGSLLERVMQYTRSAEAEGAKSPAGTEIVNRMKNIYQQSKRDAIEMSQGMLQDISHTDPHDVRKVKADNNAKVMSQNHSLALNMNVTDQFGPNKKQLSQLVKLAGKQRNPIHAQNMADFVSVALKEGNPRPFRKPGTKLSTDWRREAGIVSESPYTSKRDVQDLERRVNVVLGTMYLGRVVIPHTFQHLNTMLSEGVSAYSKAMLETLSGSTREEAVNFAVKSGALFDDTLRDMQSISRGQDTLWNKIFHMPGFSQVRKWEIIHAANAGKYAVQDAAERWVTKSDPIAKMQLEWHGIDPQQLLERKGQLTEEELLRAGYKSAEENLFIDRNIKVPHVWDENRTTRWLTLYKGFSFREGKFLKDTIIRNFKYSPKEGFKTLAILATAFPIAGEIMMSLEQLATGHNPLSRANKAHWFANTDDVMSVYEDPTLANIGDEYANAMAALASFGMNYQIFRAASRHATANWALGPVFGVGVDVAEGTAQLFKGHPKTLIKQSLRRIPVVGPAIETHYQEAVDYVNDLLD